MTLAANPLVLAVEDEVAVRRSIAGYFQDRDYRVIEAANGLAGLDLFRQQRPDVLLLDLRMPEMDGLAVLRIVHDESPETPVIVISGTGSMDDVVEALRLGAWDYFIKPVPDLSVVQHAVERSLERRQLLRENAQYRVHLEELVQKRTAALEEANLALQSKNAALSEVLSHIDAEKRVVGQQVLSSVDRLLLPMLHELRQTHPQQMGALLDQIEQTLQQITSPFADKLSRQASALTPTEIRLCHLIRQGLGMKEIANLEHISPETVAAHRRNIRRKLGLNNQKINLITYLNSLLGPTPS